MKDFATKYKRFLITLSIILLLILGTALAAFSPAYQGTQRFREVITQTLNVTNSATIQDATLDDSVLTDATITNVTLSGTVTANSPLSSASNLVVAGPTALATGVPAVAISNAGVSKQFEVKDGAVVVAEMLDGGGINLYAPTAVATAQPVLNVRAGGVSNAFEIDGVSGTPVASFDPSGNPSFPSGSIDATEIANVTRRVNIPLGTFIDCQTDAGALLGFDTTADALADYVNSATDGTGFVIRFDDTGSSEDQSSEVCSQLSVPADYASGGAFIVRALKDAHTAATEVINCAVSVNGAALETAGTVTTSAAASTSYTCTPTIAALAANDSLSFYLSITSDSTMNDGVDVAAVSFSYTATQ